MRVEYQEFFNPIINSVVYGEYELVLGELSFKITCNQEVLNLYLEDKKIADIPYTRDFEALRQVQSQVYNLINLALYMYK
ncbi:hypothetical protein [Helicobacter cholecystus]|uniref:hypothetical protein n=1 Tax=Helicobacter cholecystus TaxID=45498 RepID=UPI002739B62A|nr:hypothetical protein [Helicobacter cholecystus]